MNLVLEGYDEYVKDFEKSKKNASVMPKTEEEIREAVEEKISECGTDSCDYWSYFLDEGDSCTERKVGFLFYIKPDEEGGNYYIRYERCERSMIWWKTVFGLE